MKEWFIRLLDNLGLAFWVEITTDSPRCTYYFGPFGSLQDAEMAQIGYCEDLQAECAQNIKVTLKRCKPTVLTIVDEVDDQDAVTLVASY